MVRNVASMQSLRENMADCSMHSPPNTQPRPASMASQQDAPVSLNQPTQIVGSDSYTKWLMTRVATGVATPEEQAMWQQHVNMVKSKPVPATMPQPSQPSAMPHNNGKERTNMDWAFPTMGATGEPPLVWEPANSPEPSGMSPDALQDYQMQLMLLEQQNKKRNMMAQIEANEMKRASESSSPMPTPPRQEPEVDEPCITHVQRLFSARGVDPWIISQMTILHIAKQPAAQRKGHVDAYVNNMQSMQYMQQLMNATTHESSRASFPPNMPGPMNLPVPSKTHDKAPEKKPQQAQPTVASPSSYNLSNYKESARQDYEMQLMLLEQQNKKRLQMARQISDAHLAPATGPSTPPFVSGNNFDLLKKHEDSAAQMKPEMSKVKQEPVVSPSSFNKEAVRQDYEVQLMLLDQQNKKSLQMARQISDATLAGKVGPSTGTNVDALKNAGAAQMQPEISKAVQEPNIAGARKSNFHQKLATHRTKPVAAGIGGGPFGVMPQHVQVPAPNSKQAIHKNAAKYAEPFCKFLTENPTVFHAVDAVKKQLKEAGFKSLSERDSWDLESGGSYFVERNGSALIAFSVGSNYKSGNGAAILAGHVDALTAKLKPISQVPNKAGYLQLGVAPYAGAPNNTWWDRDLSVGGRVLVKEGDKIVSKLVKLDWPIARIPTLAPHFGAAAYGPFNPETQMVPIIGLDSTDSHSQTFDAFSSPSLIGGGSGGMTGFAATQPPRLVKAIGNALGLRTETYSNIVNWELELYDGQPATLGGLDKEFIFAGRVDDKLCSWAAIQALIESKDEIDNSSQIKMVGLFDDEEIGSLLRQGAHGNFLPTVMERAVGSLAGHSPGSDIMGRTYANSFLVSSDVTHAVNPNFLGAYLENHSPHLNVGVVVSADSNGHMTTDAVSTAVLKRCADKVGAQLQVFQIRNDSRSGGTVGPMLSSATGMRSVDAGIPQLSMHSIRATTGSLDPGLGVHCFKGFLNGFEAVDKEFRD